MTKKKGMYVLDTDISVVAISGILHQAQEWNGRTVLRPIAYGSEVLRDTGLKNGAPKSRNACGSHVCGEVSHLLGKRSIYVASGQPSPILVENLLDERELI